MMSAVFPGLSFRSAICPHSRGLQVADAPLARQPADAKSAALAGEGRSSAASGKPGLSAAAEALWRRRLATVRRARTRLGHTHVCDGIPPNFHLNTIDRRRTRAVKLVPLRSAPVQISGMLRHPKHAQMLCGGAQNPYASRSRDVDVPSLVTFHAVDDAAFENAVANLFRKNAAVA